MMRLRTITAIALLLTVGTTACKKPADEPPPPPAARNTPPKPPEHPNPTPEALERKAQSEARLKSAGVKVSATLPVIDTEKEAKIRTRDAVIERAIALMITATKAEGLEQPLVDQDRKRFGADTFFSPQEKAFIADANPSPRDKAKFGWRYECLGVMLWALGFDAKLGPPNKIVDAGHIVKIVQDRGPQKLRDDAKLRTAKELLD
jgi:hypothetical protein